MSDDDVVIGCVPVLGAGIVTIGSVQRVCRDCGTAVWLSPSGVVLEHEKNAIPVCLSCLKMRVEHDPNPRFEGITDVQRAEMRWTLFHHHRRN